MNDIRRHDARRRTSGFTLIELLVVVVIVILVSAAVLPAVIPALSNRQVSEAARIVQAALAGARDAAIRNNAPRGIRLILESAGGGAVAGTTVGPTAWVATRLIPIEPAPDLSDGKAAFPQLGFIPNTTTPLTIWNFDWSNGTSAGSTTNPPVYPFPVNQNGPLAQQGYTPAYPSFYPYFLPTQPTGLQKGQYQIALMIEQAYFNNNSPPILNPPTNWFWNVRIGDKFRFGDAGNYYTVIGPMTVFNRELFVNDGPPQVSPYTGVNSSLSESYLNKITMQYQTVHPEFLFLVNGVDDNDPPNGYVDQVFDGINQHLDFANINGVATSLVDDIAEWYTTAPNGDILASETERFLGAQATQRSSGLDFNYTITRRPVPSPGAKEISLPAGAVIDLTTWDFSPSARERSRLPVDGLTYTVDILLNQAGQVVPFTEYSSFSAAPMTEAFYHFWIADRTDVYPPTANDSGTLTFPTLPMPQDAPGYVPKNHSSLTTIGLKRDRMLLTLFARTGAVVTNSIETFDATGLNQGANAPFVDAQQGVREAK